MSVDDPDKKPLNQTRFGVPTGHANERQMLDSREDTFGIRTIIKQNGDGSETMCRTHAGMPRFFTNEVPQKYEPTSSPMFLETGHTQYPTARLMSLYTGVGSGQGRWWFKVATNALWLGYISSVTGTQSDADNRKFFGKYGGATPPSGATLYDGMISPATSVSKTPSSDLISAMVAKSAAMVSCPASMFSGKMRLFVQARYGALLDATQVNGHYRVEKEGFSVRLDGVVLSNLGSTGAGLFTTSDKRYFIIKAAGTSIQVVPLKARSGYAKAVSDLQAVIQSGAIGADLEKAEAYLFAHMEIDAANTVTFANQLPSIAPLCYSWNFKWDGSVADVISVTAAGSGINYFISTHYRLSITHSMSGSTDNWSFSVSTVSAENWIDGRGSYHIFLPDYGDGGRMVLFTMGLDFNQFPCDAKIHCFYKKDGELVFARYVRGADDGPYSHWYENDADYKGHPNKYSPSYNSNAVVVGRRKATYYEHSSATNGYQAFSVGAATYGGSFTQSSGTTVHEIGHGMGCAAPPQVRPMAEWVVGIPAYGCGYPFQGWAGYGPIYSSDPYVYKANYFFWTEENLGRIHDVHVKTVSRLFHTAVIPFFDCSAIYVYERDAKNSGDVAITRYHETCYNTTYGAQALTNIRYNPTNDIYEAYGDCIGNEFMSGWHGVYSTETFSKNLGPPRYQVGIHHFHGETSAVPTEPDSTLVNFFYVNSSYPYVDLQVWTSVNAGGNTVQLPVYNPDSTRRWTGWV